MILQTTYNLHSVQKLKSEDFPKRKTVLKMMSRGLAVLPRRPRGLLRVRGPQFENRGPSLLRPGPHCGCAGRVPDAAQRTTRDAYECIPNSLCKTALMVYREQ